MSGADKVVLCCLADDAAFARVQRVCASLELEAVRIALPAALSADPTAGVALLVCDLEASDPRLALALVHHWRSLYPDRPLLAYLKPTRLAAGLAARLGRVHGVTTWPQSSGAPDDSEPLRRLLRGLIAQVPDLLMRSVTEVLLGESPGNALRRFTDALLARLARGEPGAPPLARIAQQAGLDVRSLRRACRAARAPPPQRMSEWLTFIYVIATAEWEHVSVAQASASGGVSDRYVRRLRASLVPEIPHLRGPLTRYALTHAVLRLARECGLSPQRAEEAVGRIVGGRGDT